jgi:hypothetical protein
MSILTAGSAMQTPPSSLIIMLVYREKVRRWGVKRSWISRQQTHRTYIAVVKTLFVKVAQSGSDLHALTQFGGAGGVDVIIQNVSFFIARNFDYRQGAIVCVDA